ncbi:angiotensin-converting enzyme-like [Macrobrachium nipponense]|uniref:angiotensin-converting enzyme-like n=1 Tax=Macrobrachium nipponense TaxID=159736 RepID=UPI0030C89C4F
MVRCYPLLGFFMVFSWTWPGISSSAVDTKEVPQSWISLWLQRYNADLEILKGESAFALWSNLLYPSSRTSVVLQNQHALMAKWQRYRLEELYSLYQMSGDSRFASEIGSLTKSEMRMLHLISRGPKYTARLARSLSSMVNAMRQVYSDAPKSERDMNHLMSASRDAQILRKAWESWHLSVGPRIRPLFTEAVIVMNNAAQEGGYQDMGEAWRSELEVDEADVRLMVRSLFDQVFPLYALLHAYVRHFLVRRHGRDVVDPKGPVPVYLLGDLWGQNWESLLDLIMPDEPGVTSNPKVITNNIVPRMIVKEEEKFFEGLGFPHLPDRFWSSSVLGTSEAPPNATCQSRALDMFYPDDYRLLLCENERVKIQEAAYHELGHIHYFHSYSNQPAIFRDGANSAAHETIGDVVQLGAVNHMRQNVDKDSRISETRILLKMALRKLPLIAFARVVDEWRWDVFAGKVDESNYNKAWWDLKLKYQGVKPPSTRDETYFDPGAKFHIPDNTPYIRYFIAVVAQFQVHKNLCKISGNKSPLHKCTIARSKEAGRLLWSVMSRGSSMKWPEFLEALSGTRRLNAQPLLEYFAPLQRWMSQEAEKLNMSKGW